MARRTAFTEQDELVIAHPATAIWLDKHGFDWRHEALIADRYRVDFKARDRASGIMWLVEVKAQRYTTRAIIEKLLTYRRLSAPAPVNLALATRSVVASQKLRHVFLESGISVWIIDDEISDLVQMVNKTPDRFMALSRDLMERRSTYVYEKHEID